MIAKNKNDLEHFKFSLARAAKRNTQIKKSLQRNIFNFFVYQSN